LKPPYQWVADWMKGWGKVRRKEGARWPEFNSSVGRLASVKRVIRKIA